MATRSASVFSISIILLLLKQNDMHLGVETDGLLLMTAFDLFGS